mmetsp:Transcript_26535/g.73244  ORF Transcript_26535/g.73244 Transcript_26535/m.73244 type:complete len:227 (-) Transcript_26535:289-969(-)
MDQIDVVLVHAAPIDHVVPALEPNETEYFVLVVVVVVVTLWGILVVVGNYIGQVVQTGSDFLYHLPILGSVVGRFDVVIVVGTLTRSRWSKVHRQGFAAPGGFDQINDFVLRRMIVVITVVSTILVAPQRLLQRQTERGFDPKATGIGKARLLADRQRPGRSGAVDTVLKSQVHSVALHKVLRRFVPQGLAVVIFRSSSTTTCTIVNELEQVINGTGSDHVGLAGQ